MVGLMWLLPFLAPFKAPPIPSFHGEIIAAALGMLSVLVLPAFAARLELPRIGLLSLALIGIIILQVALGRIAYHQEALLAALYLLWVTALIILGGLFKRELGLERVANTLAWFLLCGGLISAVIGWAQNIDSNALANVMMPRSLDRVWANLGQSNQLGDYLALALVSAGYLFAVGKLRLPWALAAALALVYVLQLTGSRATLLYFAGLIGMSIWFTCKQASPINRRLLSFTAFCVIAFFCMPWIVALITAGSDMLIPPGANMKSAADRLRDSSISLEERPRIWKVALLMFQSAPLLGVGFRQFGWNHFVFNGAMPEPRVTGFTDNAHNLLLQTLAEFGIAGLCLLVAFSVLWLIGVFKQPRSAANWWLWGLALVIGAHSMLEYPLWYTFFLGIAAIVLGLSDGHRIKLQLSGDGRAARLVLIAVLAFGWLVLAQLFRDYRVLENFLAFRLRYMHATAEVNNQGKDRLLQLHRGSLLAPYVELGLARTISIDPDHLADKLVVNGRVMHLFPTDDVVFRQAMLLALHGDQADAERQWSLAVASFPEMREIALGVLHTRVDDGFTELTPLLKYAQEQYLQHNHAKES